MYELIRRMYERFKALGPHSSDGEYVRLMIAMCVIAMCLLVVALLGYVLMRP